MARIEQVELTVQDKAIHCSGCESRIETVLKKLPGVVKVKADHKTQKVQVALDTDLQPVEAIQQKLATIGFETE